MKRAGCIVADPPWHFDNQRTRAAAVRHYPTMKVDEIARLPVEKWARPNAHLYLWVTAAHLSEGLTVMKAWGFNYKHSIVWVKTKTAPTLQIGLGNYFRHAHELCLFGVRGSAPARVHNLPTVFFAPRGRHSAKPPVLQDWAEELSPGPRLEMFARRARAGWATWGNEAPQ